MFGDRDQAGIEHLALGCGAALTQHQQPEIVGEVDLTDEVRAQILAANGDGLRVRSGDCSLGIVLLADAHHASKFSLDENVCYCRKCSLDLI
ncbi:MAG: hypothetical protein MO852_10515 [Candidatus Devosia euplotis]|nr:hypothetical protein [Candidatus Devosia euplotis]